MSKEDKAKKKAKKISKRLGSLERLSNFLGGWWLPAIGVGAVAVSIAPAMATYVATDILMGLGKLACALGVYGGAKSAVTEVKKEVVLELEEARDRQNQKLIAEAEVVEE